jgi:hypothetical protein
MNEVTAESDRILNLNCNASCYILYLETINVLALYIKKQVFVFAIVQYCEVQKPALSL